eukprot:243287-Chlamydomonas_euryale.AAC.11
MRMPAALPSMLTVGSRHVTGHATQAVPRAPATMCFAALARPTALLTYLFNLVCTHRHTGCGVGRSAHATDCPCPMFSWAPFTFGERRRFDLEQDA